MISKMCRITIEVLQQEKRVAIESQMCYSKVTTQKSNKETLNCYEQCNTGYEVSSIPFEIFAEIRSNKGSDQVQNESTVHLSVAASA